MTKLLAVSVLLGACEPDFDFSGLDFTGDPHMTLVDDGKQMLVVGCPRGSLLGYTCVAAAETDQVAVEVEDHRFELPALFSSVFYVERIHFDGPFSDGSNELALEVPDDRTVAVDQNGVKATVALPPDFRATAPQGAIERGPGAHVTIDFDPYNEGRAEAFTVTLCDRGETTHPVYSLGYGLGLKHTQVSAGRFDVAIPADPAFEGVCRHEVRVGHIVDRSTPELDIRVVRFRKLTLFSTPCTQPSCPPEIEPSTNAP